MFKAGCARTRSLRGRQGPDHAAAGGAQYLADWCGGHRVMLAVVSSHRLHHGERPGALRGCELPSARAAEEKFRRRHRKPALFQDRQGRPAGRQPFPTWSTVSRTSMAYLWRLAPHCFADTGISSSSRRVVSRLVRYFRRFRAVFFDMIRPTGIHVFGSRRDAFRRDAVLQENVILSGVRQDRWHENEVDASVTISSSLGVDDIGEPGLREISAKAVLDLASADKVLRLTGLR